MSKGTVIVQILAFLLLTVLFAMGPACPKDSEGYSVSECGNGTAEEGEDCDTTDYRGQSCSDLHHGDGQVGCLDCMWDFSQCSLPTSTTCGDGTADAGEDCDGDALRNQTCESLYHGDGNLYCSTCRWDFSSCWGGCVVPLSQNWSPGTPGSVSVNVGASDGEAYCDIMEEYYGYPGSIGFRSDGTGQAIVMPLSTGKGGSGCPSGQSGHKIISVEGGTVESSQDGGEIRYLFTFPLNQDVTIRVKYVCSGVNITIVVNANVSRLTVKSIKYE